MLLSYAQLSVVPDDWTFNNMADYFVPWDDSDKDEEGPLFPKPTENTGTAFQKLSYPYGMPIREHCWQTDSGSAPAAACVDLASLPDSVPSVHFSPKSLPSTMPAAVLANGARLDLQGILLGDLGFISLEYPPRWTTPVAFLQNSDKPTMDFALPSEVSSDKADTVIFALPRLLDQHWVVTSGHFINNEYPDLLAALPRTLQFGASIDPHECTLNQSLDSIVPTEVVVDVENCRVERDELSANDLQCILNGLCTLVPTRPEWHWPDEHGYVYCCSKDYFQALSSARLVVDASEHYFSLSGTRPLPITQLVFERRDLSHALSASDLELKFFELSDDLFWCDGVDRTIHIDSLNIDMREYLPRPLLRNPPLSLGSLPAFTKFVLQRPLQGRWLRPPPQDQQPDQQLGGRDARKVDLQAGQSVVFVGYDQGDNMALAVTADEAAAKTTDNLVLVPPSHNFFRPGSQLQLTPVFVHVNLDGLLADFGQSAKWSLLETLVRRVHHRLHTVIVRGAPVFDLLHFIHCQRGTVVPIFIVGGAIRDALLNDDINDIDLAIGRCWHDLEMDIRTFFTDRGLPLSDGDFTSDGVSKRFGMMKIRHIKKNELDGLDLGIMKSRSVPKPLDPLGNDKSSKYLYGCSLERDALFRDYTVNAVYLDIFAGQLCDPVGGLKHLMASPMQVVPCAKARTQDPEEIAEMDAILQEDVGGRLRLFKLLLKSDLYTVSNEDADRICNMLWQDVIRFHVFLDTECDSVRQSGSFTPTNEQLVTARDAGRFFAKLAKKLFNREKIEKDQHSVDCLQARVEDLDRVVCAISRNTEAAWSWWLNTCALAGRVLNAEHGTLICADLLSDRLSDQWTWAVMERLAMQSTGHPRTRQLLGRGRTPLPPRESAHQAQPRQLPGSLAAHPVLAQTHSWLFVPLIRAAFRLVGNDRRPDRVPEQLWTSLVAQYAEFFHNEGMQPPQFDEQLYIVPPLQEALLYDNKVPGDALVDLQQATASYL